MLKVALVALFLVAAAFVLPRLLSSSVLPVAGSVAPNFTLKSQDGSSISLKDYRGKWVVLYFYPKDQTTGCTREAHNFQVDQAKYAERNAVVLGVSVDNVDSHKKFCTKEVLNFKLLADTDHKVSEAYGSLTNLVVVKIAARHTFLIDPQGRIAKTYGTVNFNTHSAEVLADLNQLEKDRAEKDRPEKDQAGKDQPKKVSSNVISSIP